MKKELKNKIEKCEHSWLPILYPYDGQVFGVSGEDNEVFLKSDFIIVECSECGEVGYVIAERVQ